ncbi:MAG: hypothetical protein MJ252_21800 [archaeon]|nr:hypothetical protein [archaeon]
MNFFRKKVSGQKKRLVDDKYDLDLSYITPRIIAMAFPASGLEKLYRNSIDEVSEFIKEKHGTNFRVINLANRKYDYSKFNNQVDEYEWIDHHAPPIGILFQICAKIYQFLAKDERNVAIINCQAGKGRTGTVICCLLLFSGLFPTTKDAFDYYSAKRFQKGQGVTQPSQRRYVNYFFQMLRENFAFPKIIDIIGIYLYKPKQVVLENFKPYISFYQKNSDVLDYSNKSNFLGQKKIMVFDYKPIQITDNDFTRQVIGDITIKIYNNELLKNDVIGRVSLNTYFIKENEQAVYFNLQDIDPDSLYKDKEVPRDFQIIVKYKIKKLCSSEECKWPKLCPNCELLLKEEINEYNTIKKITDLWKKEVFNEDKDHKKGLFMLFGNQNCDIEETIGKPLDIMKNEEDINYLGLLNKDDKTEEEIKKEENKEGEGKEPEDLNTSGGCYLY